MAAAALLQPAFTGGEWSKVMQGRIDRPDYRTAMNRCLNHIPLEQGAVTQRSGTRNNAVTRGGAAGRTISFDFKESAPYVIELTAGYLRFFTGNTLVKSGSAVAVSSISSATPAVVTTATHGWSTGDTVYFNAVGANNPALNNRPCLITVLSSTTFSIADAVTGTSIDGTTIGTFVSGTVSKVYELTTPYAGTTWSALRAVLADLPTLNGTTPGALFLTPGIKPYVLTVLTLPTSSAPATFSLAAAVFKDGPYFDPIPGGAQVTPSALIGNITLSLSFPAYDATRSYSVGDYVTSSSVNYRSLQDANVGHTPASSATYWVAVSAGEAVGPKGFQGTDVGRHVRLYSEPAIWSSSTTYASGAIVAFGGTGVKFDGPALLYYRSLANSNTTVPGTDTTKWVLYPTGAIWTWGRITGLSNVIDRALAGSASIGNMTSGGGLAAAFDGNFAQAASASAEKTQSGTSASGVATFSSYIGKNYASASDQTIAQATIYPSTDLGLVVATENIHGLVDRVDFVTINLRGKASVPASASDGTLLGTTGPIKNTTSAVSITSTDQTTAWKYVWVEMILTTTSLTGGAAYVLTNIACELALFSPAGSGTSSGVTVQLVGDALLYTTAIRTWRLGIYSDTTGWPSAGTYHEGRLWLTGSVDNRIDGSKSNDIYNFAPTEPSGTVTPASAISYTFNAPDVNPIFWLQPDDRGIVCGTQAGEWVVQSTTLNQPLTPTTIQAHRVTKHGCANIEPKRTDLTLAVVQKYTRRVLEFFADVYSGKFSAQSLSTNSKHLTKSGISELAYQQETTPIVWVRLGNGGFMGYTYSRDSLVSSQPPKLMAAHPHSHGASRTIVSICMGSNDAGTLDLLTMVTRGSDGVHHVEQLQPIFEEDDALVNAWFLDDGVVPSAYAAASDGLHLYGLWPHAGQAVKVFAGGLDCGSVTVDSTGSALVTFGDGVAQGTGSGLFTSAYVSSFGGLMPIIVGYAMTAQGQIVRPAKAEESGSRIGPAVGMKRRGHMYGVQFVHAINKGVYFGTSFSDLRPVIITSGGEIAYSPLTLFSGIYWDTLGDTSSFDGMLCWQSTKPYPLTLANVAMFLKTEPQ